jgi:antirestriction protein ArdC
MNKDRVEDLTKLIDEKIDALINSNDWKEYLKFASAQYRYSWNNQFLIWFQSSVRGFEATYVRGYKQWEAIDRTVKKGEKAMYVLAPMLAHRCMQKGCEAKAKYFRDGRIYICEKDSNHKVGKFLVGFKDVPVFDISQTEGEDIPQITLKDKCENAKPEIWDALVSLAESHDFKVIIGNAKGAEGYCSHDKKEIVISSNADFGYQVKILAHEVGHLLMHKDIKDYQQQRARYETEAEGVAWVVCEALGVHSDEDNYSFGYIATWGKDNTKQLVKKSLQTITKTSQTILDYVESKVDDLVKV